LFTEQSQSCNIAKLKKKPKVALEFDVIKKQKNIEAPKRIYNIRPKKSSIFIGFQLEQAFLKSLDEVFFRIQF